MSPLVAATASPPAAPPHGAGRARSAQPDGDSPDAGAPARPAQDGAAARPAKEGGGKGEEEKKEEERRPKGADEKSGGDDDDGKGEGKGGGRGGAPPRRPSRLDTEAEKRDRALAEFLGMIDEYTPVIPDLVMDYYLNKAGFDCDDVRTKRLLALAAQKFMSDIAADAFHHCKVRQQGLKKGPTKKTTLTIADLSAALSEHGMNVKKPLFYAG